MYRHRYGGSTVSTHAADSGNSAGSSSASEAPKGKDCSVKRNSESRKAVRMSSTVSKTLAASSRQESIPDTEDSAHPMISKTDKVQRKDSAAPKDLMISYSHADKEMMLRVREKLERSGISVWVDVSGLQAGVDFLSKIGEAIIDAKLFISLLSEACVTSRYCQDELALAYVSNTSIFPVAIEDPAKFKPKMDTGMKLQLARYDWTIVDENNFDEKFDALIDELKEELKRRAKQVEENKDEKVDAGKTKLERKKSARSILNAPRENKLSGLSDGQGKGVMPEKFWKDNFKTAADIDFKQFAEKLFKHFKEDIDEYFPQAEQEWLKNILKREMEVEDDNKLFKYNYDAFCMIEGVPKPLWERVFSQAMESSAMKDVFNMESSVRVEAIENLGKFRSAAVIDALRDLLSDDDANVRAVASVSLARTEANDPVTLKFLNKTLNDKDRLVREAGCLALGHLQAKSAVSKLLHLWRNDVISHVREAARVALQQIGGPEVEKAMHVTKVLADEIRQLTTQ